MKLRFILTSVAYTMLISAAVHLAITLTHAVWTSSPDSANMFNILGISLIFPRLASGAYNALLGFIVVVMMWSVIAISLKFRPSTRIRQRVRIK